MRVPIAPCPFTKEQEKFKDIGDRFLKHKAIKKHINDADQWIDMKFLQIFDVPMRDFRSVKLTHGRLKLLEDELKFLAKRVEKNKGVSGIGKALWTTGAKTRVSPEYGKLYDDFIDIQHNKKGRDITNGHGYQKILDNLELEVISRGMMDGENYSKRSFKKSIKEATKLWNNQLKLSVDSWNEVPGADAKLAAVTKEVHNYLKKGEGRVFFDFINVIEKELPKIGKEIEALSEERARLKKAGKDYSHIRKKYDTVDLLGKTVESQPLRNAVKDYLELMSDNFTYLSQGVNAYIKSIKAGLDAKGWDRGNIEIIERKLRKELLPDKEIGYFPHYTPDINAEFLNGLMLKFDRVTELTAPQSEAKTKSGQSMQEAVKEALVDTEAYITSRVKHRKTQPNDYSYLFPVIMQRYTAEVNRFNFMAHTQWKTREAINLLKKRFKNGEDIDGYGSDIVDLIKGMHFDMTGQRTLDSPSAQAFLRTVLNLEYISKIGGNVRTAGKNMSQWLVNWVEFGGMRMIESRRWYKQNPEMSAKVDQLLKESGLFYEEAPRELEEGAAFSRNKVQLSEDFSLEFRPESFWEKSANITSKVAGSTLMSGMMRKVENFNRKSAFRNQFYKTYTDLKNNSNFINERVAKGRSTTQIESEIIGRARRAAIRITTALHYDYSHVTKSEAMKHPVGAVVFQFQHFLNEFTRFNVNKLRGMSAEWKGGEGFKQKFLGPQSWQAYRLGMGYAIIPGILSLIFKTDFSNVVEHATAQKANQLFVALTGDEEEIKKAFYGKGVNITGLFGAPLIGDIVTVGELANLYEVDEDGWADMAFGFSDYGQQTGDQKAFSLMRLANGQAARFRYRTFPMVMSGHAFMGLQSELGLYPSSKIEETREDLMDGLEDLSPELEEALQNIYKEGVLHRKRATY